MEEESKEEYLDRHRKSLGILQEGNTEQEEEPENKTTPIKARWKSLFFLLLFALFLWMILQVFGMMKSN